MFGVLRMPAWWLQVMIMVYSSHGKSMGTLSFLRGWGRLGLFLSLSFSTILTELTFGWHWEDSHVVFQSWWIKYGLQNTSSLAVFIFQFEVFLAALSSCEVFMQAMPAVVEFLHAQMSKACFLPQPSDPLLYDFRGIEVYSAEGNEKSDYE